MPTNNQEDRDAVRRSIETPVTDASGRIDLEQLRHRLSLTPADRIRENDRFAEFANLVRDAGKKIFG